jgi:hypothetical protein
MPTDPLLRLLSIVGAVLGIVAALSGAARVVKTTADATYVRRDTFALYQQGVANQRRNDSLNASGALREVFHIVSGLDSSDRCRRGQSGYCR